MKETEHVNISMPAGLAEKAKTRGVNISFHATRAVEKEIARYDEVNKNE